MAEPYIFYSLFNCMIKTYDDIFQFRKELVAPVGCRISSGEIEEAAVELIQRCQREGKLKRLIKYVMETCPQEKRRMLTRILLEANKIAVSVPSGLFKKYEDIFPFYEEFENIVFLNKNMRMHELTRVMDRSCAYVVILDSSKKSPDYLRSVNDYCNYFFLKIPTYFLIKKEEKKKWVSSIWKMNFFDRFKYGDWKILEYSDEDDLITQFTSLMLGLMDPSNDWYCPSMKRPLQEKIEKGEFDVFLCYNHKDINEVIEIEERLKENSILPYRDAHIQTGSNWIKELEEKIEKINNMTVFIGPEGLSEWQEREYQAFLASHKGDGAHIFYVILKTVPANETVKIPLFLRIYQGIDFRKTTPDPLKQLISGITGSRLI